MKVLIDGDACPVVDIAVTLCRQQEIQCLLLCDTAHEMHREGAETLVFDKGADNFERNVGLDQRPADFAHGRLDIGSVERAASPKTIENFAKPVA